MSSTHRVRRSHEQWRALFAEQQASGLNQIEFCRQRAIGYSTFCKWRQRLADDDGPMATDAFIELPAWAETSAQRWQIELALGDGMVLRLSRG